MQAEIQSNTLLAPNASKEPILPIPLEIDLDQELLQLGEMLFHDPRLSANNTISCASCHSVSAGGMDSKKFSTGINGQKGNINTPTVFNSHFNFRQFWDGRAASLEEQVSGPIQHPSEMGSSWPQVLGKLRADSHYQHLFKKYFGSEITPAGIRLAIATYERSLITPNSPFDRYLKGEKDAIGSAGQQGYVLFKSLGCIACHQGVNVGGNMYQYFGVMGDYFTDRGNITKADYGLFNRTGNESDRFKFKVPSLRNIALTAPYFHDGQATTLVDAVKIMGRYQLGVELDSVETALLVTFLQNLTGDQPRSNHADH